MKDSEIVDLYWQRDQSAISRTDEKYGKSLVHTSYRILNSREDAEECLQDTYLSAWNNMPDDRPEYLGAYLMKIIRNCSLNRYRHMRAQKRYNGETLAFEELSECISDNASGVFEAMVKGELAGLINEFLATLSDEKRRVFVRRYFFSDSVKDISANMNMSESKVKSMLMRLRQSLEKYLRESGQ